MDVPNGRPLTSNQLEVVTMLAQGFTHEQIAVKRGTSVSAVWSLLSAAYRKLGVSNAAQCVAKVTEGERVTAAQSLYLKAFDRWLRDPTLENTDARMFWLRGVFHEADVTPPWELLGTPKKAGFLPKDPDARVVIARRRRAA